MEDKITFNVVRHIGVLSEAKSGWVKELNLLSWNGRLPKYDIRDWGPERVKAGKGITLSKEEALKLAALINADLADEPGSE
jgi:hypothetical protein